MNLLQGRILLIPFPFSDQSGKKVRPVVIVSNDKFNVNSQDIIVCGITTNISKDFYTVKIDSTNLEEKNLHDECCVKVENILRIDKKLIIKDLDSINRKTFDEIISKLKTIF